MSRDFTPKELLASEKWQIENGHGSLWDFMENTSFEYKGERWPLHTTEEIVIRKQYPTLGKLLNHFEEAYSSLSKIPGGLDVLEKNDKEIALYVETGEGDSNSSVIKWFNGELDKDFYYSDINEELLLEHMQEEAERVQELKNQSNKNLFDDTKIKYTGEEVDLSDCDRIVAIMIADGKMYLSDCDHQDCLEQYCQDIGKSSGIDWSDPNKFDENQNRAMKITESLFASENNDVHGFSVFEGNNFTCYITSHFPSNLASCFEMIKEYAEESDCIIGTFYDSSYKIKVVDIEETEKALNKDKHINLDEQMLDASSRKSEVSSTLKTQKHNELDK